MSAKKFGAGDNVDDWTQKIHSIMEEMSNRIFFEYRASGTWQPRVNLYATRHAFVLCVELAGLNQDALLVRCGDQQRVHISGKRERAAMSGLECPHSIEMMEIDEGPFSRDIDIPEPVDPEGIEIAYDRGYLWIILPKSNQT